MIDDKIRNGNASLFGNGTKGIRINAKKIQNRLFNDSIKNLSCPVFNQKDLLDDNNAAKIASTTTCISKPI